MKLSLPIQDRSGKTEQSFFTAPTLKGLFYFMVALLLSLQGHAQGTWSAVTATAPNSNGGVMLLLSDGTVIAKTGSGGSDGIGNIWNKLTPDIHGSYIHGTWSSIAAMHDTRLYFSSQVLKDGRVFVAGGEYGTGGAKGETYDPLTNTWTTTPAPGATISDANSEILSDGRVLNAMVSGTLKSTKFYNPANNTWTTGPNCNGIHNESAWVKLPDNSILFVDRLTTNSERYIPSLNQWVTDATVPVQLYDSFGDETGAAILLPDGRAFFLGSTSHTAYYTPSGTNSPGSWSAGPDIPGNHGTPDAAAAMMVNGKILCAVSPVPTSANHFPSPTSFYEFNYVTNSFTSITTPTGSSTLNISCYITNMLDLPDGTVLYSQQGSSQYYVYTPNGTPLASGKPVISSVIQSGCNSFKITGTQFNGISQGASYGDDWQMSTNYPIIRLTSGTNVYYARTFNWNTTGVKRGTLADTTQFTLPAGIPAGTYSLVVVANGIASDPVTFIPTPILSSSLTPPATCSNNTFTYAPTSDITGATFTWTRAAVTGISNPAVTVPQTSNPNEVLINTTTTAKNVVYSYTITANGCSNTQQVTVVVNPSATLSSSLTPPAICNNNAFTYTPSSATAGATFTWMRAAVTGISNPAVTSPQSSNPNEVLVNISSNPVSVVYSYVTSFSGCSVTQPVTVVVNPSPTLSSTLTPPDICNNSAFTYTPTSAIAGATFTWTRAAVAGIANAAVTVPQSSNPNEVLVNTTSNPVSVTYSYKINGNGCVNMQQVTVVVNPSTNLTSTLTPDAICSNNAFIYMPTSDAGGATFTWTRPAVAGISNAAVTIPQTTDPNEILINTTSSPISVVYNYTISFGGCSTSQQVTVVVNPASLLSSTLTPDPICSNTSFTYTPASLDGSASFTWTRASVTGISNGAITTPQTNDPNEVLINTTADPVIVVYTYSISSNGCGTNQDVTVLVNPTPALSSTLTPPGICSNSAFTYSPTSLTSGAAFTWIRDAVEGLSNAAIMVPQSSNPNEILNDTVASSLNVVYQYTIVANGCSNTQDVTVAVSPAAFLNSTLTPPSICSGSVFTYSPSSATPGVTFTWTRDAVAGISNAAINTQQTSNPNEMLINTSSSVVGVTYEYTTTINGCSTSQDVIVNVNPSPTLSSTLTPAPICSNSSFTYSPSSATTGATFTWTRAAVAGISNTAVTVPQTVNPNEVLINTTSSPVNVVYAYSITGNGCSNTQSVVVTVNPTPNATISGSTTFCTGGSTTLTANGGAGISYQWIKGTANVAGATNQTFVATKAAGYKVKETTSSGCTSTSSVFTVSVISNPTATITPLGNLDICATGSVVLQANGGAGLTYQWIKGTTNIAGATNQTYTATTKGTYKVIVTNSNGCSKTSTGAKVTKSCKEPGIESELLIAELNIFPNPAEDLTTIQFTLTQSSHVTIKIFDMSGKEMETVLNSDADQGVHSLQFNVHQFAKGMYVIRMITGSVIENEKLLVQ